jgi:hypothetical protein
MIFDIFMEVTVKIVVFWVVIVYKYCGPILLFWRNMPPSSGLSHTSTMKMEAACSCKTLVFIHEDTSCYNPASYTLKKFQE